MADTYRKIIAFSWITTLLAAFIYGLVCSPGLRMGVKCIALSIGAACVFVAFVALTAWAINEAIAAFPPKKAGK